MNQSEQPFAGIDEAIGQMEKLYRAMTGADAPSMDAAYAPIPAEKDPAQHVEEQMSRLLDLLGKPGPESQATPAWNPPVSVWESDAEILICVDLPGLRREQVELVVRGNTLTVTGSRPAIRDGFRIRSCEWGLGSFRRTFFVPAGLRGVEPSAQMRDGVLEIRLPRQALTAAAKPVPVH